jgi:cation transport regulator ChaB
MASPPHPDPSTLTTAALTREVEALKELMFTRLDAMDKAMELFQNDITRVPTDTDRQIKQLSDLLDEKFKGIEERISGIVALREEMFHTVDVQFNERDKRRQFILDAEKQALTTAIQASEHQINLIKELYEEKFNGIQTQFKERDTRSERESRDNKVAVDAAFAAQKEAAAKQDEANQKAIDKSEKATSDTLAKQADLFNSTTDYIRVQIGDLKDRLTRLEGMGLGTLAANQSQQAATVTHQGSNSIILAAVAISITALIGLAGLVISLLR